MRNDGARRYEALDGLRGVAASCVMIGHFGQILGSSWPAHMFLAVDIFFVMSGFVIAHSYGERLRDGLPAWAYLSRRIVRLYPMFIVGLLIGTGVLYFGASRGIIAYRSGDILRSAALNALYIPFLNTDHIWLSVGQIFPADPPAWSLFLEILASAGFLLVFDLPRRTLILLSLICYLTLAASGLYFARRDGWVGIDVSIGFDSHNILGGLPRAAFGFTLGILLHALLRDGVGTRIAAAAVRRLPYPSFALYAVVLAVFLFPWTLRGGYPMLALATAVPALVFVAATLRPARGLEAEVARFLGWISYPVYCLHVPVLRFVLVTCGGVRGSAFAMAALGVAVTLALAAALTHWYEEPVRAALSRRLFAASSRLTRPAGATMPGNRSAFGDIRQQ